MISSVVNVSQSRTTWEESLSEELWDQTGLREMVSIVLIDVEHSASTVGGPKFESSVVKTANWV